jgi:hypothetical protein
MTLRRILAFGSILAALGPWSADAAQRRHLHKVERSAWSLSFSETGRDGAPEVYAENFARWPTPRPADWGAIEKLVAFCRDHKPGLEIKTDSGAWGYSFWGPAYGVAYRVAADPPAGQIWLASEAVNAAVFPGDAVAFLQTLPEDGVIAFRVSDAFGHDHEASFRLRGVATVRRLIAKACTSL